MPTKIPFVFSWACRRKFSRAHENSTQFRRSLLPTKITLYFRGPADENSPTHENLGVSCSEWDLDPPYGVRAAHSGVPGFQDRTYPGLNQDPGGGPEPTRVQTWSRGIRTYPHTLLLPAQAETRCCHMAYCARHKPTGGTWHDASGLRAPSHSLQIRRASVHSTDRRHAQSTLRGPCSYSHVTISRAMTRHYSYVSKKRVTTYQCCMDYSHHDSR
jgi:hypothetical protein